MASEDKLPEDKDKSIASKGVAIYYIKNCEQCKWNGFPNEKIFLKFVGLRPETEDGFIYKFEEYGHSEIVKTKIHKHRFDRNLTDEDQILRAVRVSV